MVDNDNVIAWTAGLKMSPMLATRKGGIVRKMIASTAVGEGVVLKFKGTGMVLLESRIDRYKRLEKRVAALEFSRTASGAGSLMSLAA